MFDEKALYLGYRLIDETISVNIFDYPAVFFFFFFKKKKLLQCFNDCCCEDSLVLSVFIFEDSLVMSFIFTLLSVTFAVLGEKTTVMSPEVFISAGVPCCRYPLNPCPVPLL